MDQEQPKVDPGGSTGSQIRHLDQAYIEFPGDGLGVIYHTILIPIPIPTYLMELTSKK